MRICAKIGGGGLKKSFNELIFTVVLYMQKD